MEPSNPEDVALDRLCQKCGNSVSFTANFCGECGYQFTDGLFPWGGEWYEVKNANRHFFVTGATGSGKTVTIRLLMQTVIPYVVRRREESIFDHRAVIYDAKQEMLTYLLPMLDYKKLWKEETGQSDDEEDDKKKEPPSDWLPSCVKVLNPFDVRCSAWDMAADIASPAAAQQMAAILIPEEKNATQPFFTNAARHLLYGVLMAFITKRKAFGLQWTFRDVVLAMRSEKRMRELFEQPECKRYIGHLTDMYLHAGQTLNSIKATVATKMMPYEVVAAAWSEAATERDMISLRNFVQGKERLILVLGNDETNREAVDAINRVLFKRLSELIVGQPEASDRRTWVILDEVREAGRLDGLSSLLLRGRSKGACIVLGFQDIDGLRDVYGQYQAQELVGQCSFKAILRLESPSTAEWASQHFGTVERIVKRANEGTAMGEHTTFNAGTTEQLEKTEVVLPIQILKIPPVSEQKRELTGYYLVPLKHFVNVFRFGKDTDDPFLPKANPYETQNPARRKLMHYFQLMDATFDVGFLPRADAHQYLEDTEAASTVGSSGRAVPPPNSSETEESDQITQGNSEKKQILKNIVRYNYHQ